MKKILSLNASSAPEASSRSRALSNYFKQLWLDKFPEDKFIERDIYKSELPHINHSTVKAFYTPTSEYNKELTEASKLSEELIEELTSADILLISCPMYNFSITSSLKAYFDLVARVGVTFHFTDTGPVGLLNNTKAFIITTRGGFYVNHPDDQQVPYFKSILKFLGINDINFFHADGLDTSPENLEKGMASAKKAISQFIENY